MKNPNILRQLRRKKRISSNITGLKDRPRISIYRSNRFIYAQAIDDSTAKTLASSDSRSLKKTDTVTKKDMSSEVGKILAKKLLDKKIKTAVFDRSSFAYKGRVQALADGIREGGVKI